MGTHQNVIQGAIVLTPAVIGALGNGAGNALVGSAIATHNSIPPSDVGMPVQAIPPVVCRSLGKSMRACEKGINILRKAIIGKSAFSDFQKQYFYTEFSLFTLTFSAVDYIIYAEKHGKGRVCRSFVFPKEHPKTKVF